MSQTSNAPVPALIAVDWGSTNFRAYLLSADGDCLAKVSSEQGMLNANGNYAGVLQTQISHWRLDFPTLPILMAGMIGSRQGWVEAPYVSCPVTAVSLAKGVVKVADDAIANCWIVPGAQAQGVSGGSDIMRGEEVQMLGALAQLNNHVPDWLCLPGTHNKWARIVSGKIEQFSTCMTGEMFNLLSQHSMLKHTLDLQSPFDREAFHLGLGMSQRPGGLLHQLFSVRSRVIADAQPILAGADYLSGVLIGHEINDVLEPEINDVGKQGSVAIVASSALAERYRLGLEHAGYRAVILDAEKATLAGIVAVAKAAELIPSID